MSTKYETNYEKWTELHSQLQDMLAGYADNELDAEEELMMNAHLAGCESCRNDLARQQLLNIRLESIPAPRMTTEMHNKIDQTLINNKSSIQSKKQPVGDKLSDYLNIIKKRCFTQPVIAGSGWAIAIVFAIILMLPTMQQKQSVYIPMIVDALSEYYLMQGESLPVSSSISDIKAPLNWHGAQLVATWDTTVAGAAAKAYALRSGNNIIFQFRIDQNVFFRNPEVRLAISESGNYQTIDNKTSVLALPLGSSGILVIGPENALPEPSQFVIESI